MTTIGPVPASSTGRFRSTIRPGTVPIQQARHVSALEILANRFQLVSRLADDLAHEIKNPLHAMVINLELVKRRAQAGDVSTVLERADLASAEVMRVNALLDQLLQLLRPARQGDRVLDLDAAVGEVLPLLAHQARLSKVELVYHGIGGPLGIPMRRDAVKLVLLNLVSELLEPARPGSSLEIAATARDETVGLVVSESEAGSTPGAEVRLAHPPSADLTRIDRQDVARTLVEQAGGSFSVQGEEHEARRFLMEFPRRGAP